MGKIISISGTHCTGKSTLVESLKKCPELSEAVFLKSSGRELAQNNPKVRINEDGDFYTQFYQMSRDIATLLEVVGKKLVICDRSYIDTFIYSVYLFDKGKMSVRQMKLLEEVKLGIQNLVSFDKVYLLKPSFELQKEKNRSMDQEFQQEIFELFDKHKLFNWEYLPDDLESRIKIIIDYAKK